MRRVGANSREAFLIEGMAKAMAKRAGTPIDEMRPSTWHKWRQFAEAALVFLAEEVEEMKATSSPASFQGGDK